MKFPNKVVEKAYEKAKGKIFTWSSFYQVFTDENGNSEYNYSAMLWLKDNGYMTLLPWAGGSIVYRFQLK
jgi:hypothetical protein